MKAIRIHGRGGPDHLVYEDAPQPHPGPGEVLVRIHATGVIATELQWDETYQTATGSPRTLPIPGRDLSGVVEEIGQGVTTFAPGAQVIATASARNRDFLHELGASVVIDYSAERFEEVVHHIDVVFDLVGGETLARSWQVLKPGGVLVSVVSPQPPADVTKGHDARFAWFIVEPNRELLIQIGALIDAGQLRPIIDAVFPLSQARQAYEQGTKGHMRGKIVLRVAD